MISLGILFIFGSCFSYINALDADSIDLPTKKEYEALNKMGGALMYMAAVAWDNPQAVIDLLDSSQPTDKSKREMNEPLERIRKLLTEKRTQEEEDAFIKAVKEYGVYKALVGKMFVEGVIYQNVQLAVNHAMELLHCENKPETCPKEPDFEKLVLDAIKNAGKRSNADLDRRELLKKLINLLS